MCDDGTFLLLRYLLTRLAESYLLACNVNTHPYEIDLSRVWADVYART